MRQIRKLKRARLDLIEIWKTSYGKWGIKQANDYLDALDNSFNLLLKNPDMGRSCEDIKQGYRRHEIERHIVFYRKTKTGITVVRVLDNRVDVKRHM